MAAASQTAPLRASRTFLSGASEMVDSTAPSTYVDGMETTALVAAAADDDPRTGLRAVRALRMLCEQLEATQVRRARDRGWSWREIAEVLQVSKQAVHRKYRRQ